MSVPTLFSNLPENSIRETYRSSIFHVMLTPVRKAGLKRKFKAADSILKDEHEEAASLTRVSTGFVVSASEEALMILTCCHTFDDCYSSCGTITAAEVEKLFCIKVVCDHQHAEKGYDPYSNATVEMLNHKKDVLLLRVDINNIKKKKRHICLEPHPSLKLSESSPCPTDKVFMLSWPPDLHLTAVQGRISYISRNISAVGDNTISGYDMTLIEADIKGHNGSSGGPLLDHNGSFIGLLHAHGNNMSYFVDLPTIRAVLDECLINFEDDGR